MIESDRELEIVREQIVFLAKARDSSRNNPELNEFYKNMESSGFQRKLDQLQQEVNEYENSKAQRIAATQAFG